MTNIVSQRACYEQRGIDSEKTEESASRELTEADKRNLAAAEAKRERKRAARLARRAVTS